MAIVLVLYAGITSVWESGTHPFFYDEIFTALLSGLPSMAATMDALRGAADTSGPFYYVVVRQFEGLLASQEVSLRLPSVLASTVTYVCVFVFARRDLGVVAALVALMVMLLSRLSHGYAVEARPYSLMIMWICLAAVAWQRASDARWRIVLGISAALAVGTHYYAVFVAPAFALAESLRTVRTREFRMGVWLSLGCGLVVLAALWPVLDGLRHYYGAHYYSKPTLGKALSSYDWVLFAGLPGAGFGAAAVLGLAMLKLSVKLWPNGEQPERHRPAPETLAFVMMLLATPLTCTAVVSLMGGGFAERYALGVLAGIGLSVAYAVRALDDRKQVLAALGLACVLAAHELVVWSTNGLYNGRRPIPLTSSVDDALRRASGHDLPIVVDSGTEFLELVFYGTSRPGLEVLYLTDPDAARSYTSSDSIDLDLLALGRFVDLNIQRFDTFKARQDQFLLLSAFGSSTWWPTRLADEDYRMTLVGRGTRHALFLVQADN